MRFGSAHGFLRACALLGVLTAPGAAAPSSPPADLAAGRRIAHQCETCHAIGVSGESPLPIAPRFRDLSQRYPLDNLQEALAEGIVVAHNAPMPEFRLSAADIDHFLTYLHAIQTRPTARAGALKPQRP